MISHEHGHYRLRCDYCDAYLGTAEGCEQHSQRAKKMLTPRLESAARDAGWTVSVYLPRHLCQRCAPVFATGVQHV